jgi:transketolase
LDRAEFAPATELHRGAYVLWQSSDAAPAIVLIGTGSETHLAQQAGKQIASDGIAVRVVAMPSWELFERQPREYRDNILPPSVRARVAVEAGAALGWERYVGLDGASIGLNRFGASAPGAVVYARLGFTVANLVQVARGLLGQ